MRNIIHFFIVHKDKQYLHQKLTDKYSKQDAEFIPIDLMNMREEVNESLTIVLFEPIFISPSYYSIHRVWKSFLMNQAPSIKLIVAGFMGGNKTNYLDMLNLPDDFKVVSKKAEPVSSDFQIPIAGRNLIEVFEQLFKGHGNNSLLSQFNKILQSLNVITYSIAERSLSYHEIRETLIEPYLSPELDELIKRFEKYHTFFQYVPFLSDLIEAERTVNDIRRLLSHDLNKGYLFIEKDFEGQISQIIQNLQKIDEKYIHPEL